MSLLTFTTKYVENYPIFRVCLLSFFIITFQENDRIFTIVSIPLIIIKKKKLLHYNLL